MRARVRALPNLKIVQRCEVTGLLSSGGRDRVTGARVLDHSDPGAEQRVEADLVVDATGRGGRMATCAQGSLAFAGTVAPAHLLAAIRDAEPL
ncbi:MAG: FAD-binding monooxygenase, partial [Pseudonocardia sp.]|nr:FAD-binding monooxygenase [Pseudonocardia sp.]